MSRVRKDDRDWANATVAEVLGAELCPVCDVEMADAGEGVFLCQNEACEVTKVEVWFGG